MLLELPRQLFVSRHTITVSRAPELFRDDLIYFGIRVKKEGKFDSRY